MRILAFVIASFCVLASFPALAQKVSGNFANGSVRVGNDTGTCDSARYGAIRFNTNKFQGCSTSGWVDIGTFGGGTLPSLTSASIWVGDVSNVATAVSISGDATLSNVGVLNIASGAIIGPEIADGSINTGRLADGAVTASKLWATGTPGATTYLRGDGTWATPSGSGGGAGTSMVSGWPDALRCGDSSAADSTFILGQVNNSPDKTWYYRAGTTSWINFTSAGVYNASVGGSEGAGCSGKTISQLYSEGKAFNFVGGGSGGGGSATWVNFTPSSGTIKAANNVTGVSRTSTGQYRITFATAMPNVNYVTLCHGQHYSGVTWRVYFGPSDVNSQTTGYVDVIAMGDGTFFDPSWMSCAIHSGTGGGDTLSSLSCTTGQVAQWNGTAWVCASVSGAGAGSSIVTNFPDALFCTASNGDKWIYMVGSKGDGTASGNVFYYHAAFEGRYMVFTSAGAWSSEANGTSNCSSKTISQLQAANQAINFVGGGSGGGVGGSIAQNLGLDGSIWPDFIKCQRSPDNFEQILQLEGENTSGTLVSYVAGISEGSGYYKNFTKSTGAHSSQATLGASCDNETLAQICAANRCIFGGGGVGDTLSSLSCTTGQVAQWNGTAWACANMSSGSGGAGAVAMVKFNGATCSPNCTIASQLNVSSVTRTGSGQYTVSFSSALPDANYILAGTVKNSASASVRGSFVGPADAATPFTTTSAMIEATIVDSNQGTYIDAPEIHAVFMHPTAANGGSGTSMVSGWPDAISCTGSGYTTVLVLTMNTGAYVSYVLAGNWSTTNAAEMRFNIDGSFNSLSAGSYVAGAFASCSNKSVTQLVTAGQAFNFVGGGADNLGNHTATQDLSMAGKSITNVKSLIASSNDVIAGEFYNSSAAGYSIYAESADGTGIVSTGLGAFGTGLYANGTSVGVFGYSDNGGGISGSSTTGSGVWGSSDTGTGIVAQAGAATAKPLVVMGALSQSSNLQEWQTSTGSVVANVTAAGVFTGSGAGLTALNASNLGSGTVPSARLGTGTANATTYLRGDGTWATRDNWQCGVTDLGYSSCVRTSDGHRCIHSGSPGTGPWSCYTTSNWPGAGDWQCGVNGSNSYNYCVRTSDGHRCVHSGSPGTGPWSCYTTSNWPG